MKMNKIFRDMPMEYCREHYSNKKLVVTLFLAGTAIAAYLFYCSRKCKICGGMCKMHDLTIPHSMRDSEGNADHKNSESGNG